MEIRFNGYKTWKGIKEELGLYTFYILPTIELHSDDAFWDEKNRIYEFKIAWLLWELKFYFKK